MTRIKQIDLCWQILLIFSCIVSCLGDRYAFFTDLHRKSGNMTRRVFGGHPVPKGAYPNTCLLLDHHMGASCSCTVLAPRWALTAAHCATSKQMYVKYTRFDGKADSVPIHLLYVHPEYRVVSRDDGAGMDVVLLHNDVGLVRTRRSMLVAGNSSDALSGLQRDSNVTFGEEVEVLGFGRTEKTGAGLELRATRLKLASCERGPAEWRHCSCARGAGRGVCAGDSGGPVLYRGRQIGVNSMGPVTCAPITVLTADDTSYPLVTNVFTALPPYVGLINDTIHDSNLNAEKMIAIQPKDKSEEIVEYVRLKTKFTLRVERLESSRGVNFNSFVVRVPTEHLSTFSKEEFWPKGVVFRRFRGRLNSDSRMRNTTTSK